MAIRKSPSSFSAHFGALVQSKCKAILKGTYITVPGAEFSTREYEHNGEKRTSLELTLDKFDLGPRAAQAGSDDRRADAPAPQTIGQSQTGAAVSHIIDDEEIPF